MLFHWFLNLDLYSGVFQKLKEQGVSYLQQLLRASVLSNQHRVVVTMSPDQQYLNKLCMCIYTYMSDKGLSHSFAFVTVAFRFHVPFSFFAFGPFSDARALLSSHLMCFELSSLRKE